MNEIRDTLVCEMPRTAARKAQIRSGLIQMAAHILVLAFVACLFIYIKGREPLHAAPQNGALMTKHATGPFDVKLAPQGEPDKADGSTLARYSVDKQYHGALDATATGTMLSAGTDVKGSAGYVAMERVTGKLDGRSGSFVLQHSGTLTRGAPEQSITVVPDSGTGQLTGLTGKLTVIIDSGKHSYDFDYALPAAP